MLEMRTALATCVFLRSVLASVPSRGMLPLSLSDISLSALLWSSPPPHSSAHASVGGHAVPRRTALSWGGAVCIKQSVPPTAGLPRSSCDLFSLVWEFPPRGIVRVPAPTEFSHNQRGVCHIPFFHSKVPTVFITVRVQPGAPHLMLC